MGRESLAIHELHTVGGHTGLRFQNQRDEDAFGALLLGAGSGTRRFTLKPSLYLRSIRPSNSPCFSQSQADTGTQRPPPALVGYRDGCSQCIFVDEAEEVRDSIHAMGQCLTKARQQGPTGETVAPVAPPPPTLSPPTSPPALPPVMSARLAKRRRLNGKRSCHVLEVPAMTPGSVGHTLQPDRQGQRISVIGDGWGGGKGGYEAVVIEADDYTYTVVDDAWQETHVLKEHCVSIDDARARTATSGRKRQAPRPGAAPPGASTA